MSETNVSIELKNKDLTSTDVTLTTPRISIKVRTALVPKYFNFITTTNWNCNEIIDNE